MAGRECQAMRDAVAYYLAHSNPKPSLRTVSAMFGVSTSGLMYALKREAP